jgi:hypothetical protein
VRPEVQPYGRAFHFASKGAMNTILQGPLKFSLKPFEGNKMQNWEFLLKMLGVVDKAGRAVGPTVRH